MSKSDVIDDMAQTHWGDLGTSAQNSAALRIRLLDVHVLHVHHMADQAVLVFTILSAKGGKKYPGSITVPMHIAQKLLLESGDEFTILLQKTLSQHHVREGKK